MVRYIQSFDLFACSSFRLDACFAQKRSFMTSLCSMRRTKSLASAKSCSSGWVEASFQRSILFAPPWGSSGPACARFFCIAGLILPRQPKVPRISQPSPKKYPARANEVIACSLVGAVPCVWKKQTRTFFTYGRYFSIKGSGWPNRSQYPKATTS